MGSRRYHKSLRISLVIVAIMLIFDSGFVSPVSKQLSDNTIQYIANSIGIFAAVNENPLNKITAELTARNKELDEREANLKEREIAARNFGTGSDVSTYILSTILFILTVLIVLNYAMDFVRMRRLYKDEQKST